MAIMTKSSRVSGLTRDQIAERRHDIEDLIAILQMAMMRHEQDIAALRDKINFLQARDAELARRDKALADAGLAELIRMCHTPCWRYRVAS
jgi:chromosome segregation ATPase